jgi:hypothetical protein
MNPDPHDPKMYIILREGEEWMEVDVGPLIYTVNKPELSRDHTPVRPEPPKRPLVFREPGDNVYFIVEAPFNNVVKIGHSKNPARRLSELQTGNDRILKIHKTIPNVGRMTEQIIHAECTKYRKHGEWFKMTLAQIDRIARKYGAS